MSILGLGPTEFVIVLVFALVPFFFVVQAVRKEPHSQPESIADSPSAAARLWHSYTAPFRSYATMSGRATIREYWTFTLVNVVVSLALGAIDAVLVPQSWDYGPLQTLFLLATLIPGITVTVRRLHDSDRSGGWFFIPLVPLVGWFISIYQLTRQGTPGVNRFGADPREEASPNFAESYPG